MRRADEIIVQGALRSSGFGGRVDVLRRVDVPSDLGDWSYEVIDTKLARTTTGGTILQIVTLVAQARDANRRTCTSLHRGLASSLRPSRRPIFGPTSRAQTLE